jgi:hypothetical protein
LKAFSSILWDFTNRLAGLSFFADFVLTNVGSAADIATDLVLMPESLIGV